MPVGRLLITNITGIEFSFLIYNVFLFTAMLLQNCIQFFLRQFNLPLLEKFKNCT